MGVESRSPKARRHHRHELLGGLTRYWAQARELLREQGGDVARRAQEFATEAQGRAGEWLDKSRELFEEQTQRLMSAFEAGKDAMREEIRKGSAPSRG